MLIRWDHASDSRFDETLSELIIDVLPVVPPVIDAVAMMLACFVLTTSFMSRMSSVCVFHRNLEFSPTLNLRQGNLPWALTIPTTTGRPFATISYPNHAEFRHTRPNYVIIESPW